MASSSVVGIARVRGCISNHIRLGEKQTGGEELGSSAGLPLGFAVWGHLYLGCEAWLSFWFALSFYLFFCYNEKQIFLYLLRKSSASPFLK